MIAKRFFKNYLNLENIESNSLKKLIWSLYAITFLGIITSVVSITLTGYQEKYFNRSLCFNNTCIKTALDGFSQSFLIIQATLSILVTVATVGGIFVALLSYMNSVSVSALGNHISHFKIFQEYISFEIKKRDRLSLSSFDIFKWYNTIFNKSRSGLTLISDEYIYLIDSLNDKILISNEASENARNGSFSYVKHQKNMISILLQFGIKTSRLPRNDFYEVEDQIIDLIQNINREFCYSKKINDITKRNYR
ncbi:retron Ec48 family effector membrane protein [Lonsdalea quercina]|uniref:retron Ec48 family effector membrane protein n=1 Tax=Lonsdalea quercina TaxID=71657 RepID=UPI003976E610